MKKIDKQLSPALTLGVIYLSLVLISIFLYILIQTFFSDTSTASNLMNWSATIFATIALLYTFNGWKAQKQREEIALLAQKVFNDLELNSQLYFDISNQIHDANLGLVEIDKTKAIEIHKIFKDRLLSPYNTISRIKSHSKNKNYAEQIELYLKQTSSIYSYISLKSLGLDMGINQLPNIYDYYNTYNLMKDSIFRISIYDY